MVRDNVTGLIWEIKTSLDGAANYSDPHDADNVYTWCDPNPDTNGGYQGTCGDHDTKDFIDQLNSGGFGGYTNWRLPTIKELATLADLGRISPAIDPVFAATTQSSWYWSSTTQVGYTDTKWLVTFYSGYVYNVGFPNGGYVRAVRSGQDPVENRFIDNGDGTVTDTVTCLQWQKATMDTKNGAGPDAYNWQDALAVSENLSLAGHTDWRLPDRNELRSLIDHSRGNPVIDPVFAATTQSIDSWSDYWSSTTCAGNTNGARRVDFSNGYDSCGDGSKSSGYYVRAVRGGQCGGFGTWTPSPPIGRIYNFPMKGLPGTTFTQSGTGFTPNSTVTLHFRNHLGQELTPIQQNTDASGSFSLIYTAPLDKPIGTHSWWAVDDTTGGMSDVIRYQIIGDIGTQSSITQGQTTPLESVYVDLPYGTLTSEGVLDPNKETFVIVHGWNIHETTEKPPWMARMGDKIFKKGANVLYWNWQQKAKTKITNVIDYTEDHSCIDTNFPIGWVYLPHDINVEDIGKKVEIPYDETDNSGKYLAVALKKAFPSSYSRSIHLVGHSLGSLVSTYAAKFAVDKNLPYAAHINHLIFLDSPCYGGVPGDGFLNNKKDKIFFENYMSQFGRPYKEADVDVWLQPKANLLSTVVGGHGYSHDWYESSVTNFTDHILENHQPSSTMKWGFYWWNESNRENVKSDYSQKIKEPNYKLFEGNLWDVGFEKTVGAVIDVTGGLINVSAPMFGQLYEWAESVGKVVKIFELISYSVASDAAGAVVDTADHAFYDSTYGYLNLMHSSTAVLDLPITIPTEANALSLGTEFLYSDPGSILEVFINGKLVYHVTSDLASNSGLQMVPWISVQEYAGQSVTLSLRLSNPNADTEGKIKIDDLVLARIEDPEVPDGDINNDGSVNLTDTILALQIVNGQAPSNKLYRNADVNTDEKIGIPEVIYTLQKVAGLK